MREVHPLFARSLKIDEGPDALLRQIYSILNTFDISRAFWSVACFKQGTDHLSGECIHMKSWIITAITLGVATLSITPAFATNYGLNNLGECSKLDDNGKPNSYFPQSDDHCQGGSGYVLKNFFGMFICFAANHDGEPEGEHIDRANCRRNLNFHYGRTAEGDVACRRATDQDVPYGGGVDDYYCGE